MIYFSPFASLAWRFRNNSQIYCRFLSIAMVLFSLAPLGSLYLVLFSLGFSPPSEGDATIHMLEDVSKAAATTTTLDHIWAAFFVGTSPHLHHIAQVAAGNHHRHQSMDSANNVPTTPSFLDQSTTTTPSSSFFLASRYLPGKVETIHHLSVILPWLFTFIFGVVVPAGLSLYSFWRQHHHQIQQNGLDDPCGLKGWALLKRARVEDRLKRFCHQLRKQDFCGRGNMNALTVNEKTAGDDASTSLSTIATSHQDRQSDAPKSISPSSGLDSSGTEGGHKEIAVSHGHNVGDSSLSWRIPCPLPRQNTPLEPVDVPRIIPDTCAICLHSYQEGDVVCRSPDPECIHVFHEACIVTWLVSRQERHDCPCCRRSFFTDKELFWYHVVWWWYF